MQFYSFARARLRNPRGLVFDEATSSLDPMTEQTVLHRLRRLRRGRTTIVIAHRLPTIINADQILVLDHGAIVEQGTHSSLLAGDGLYAALWRAQQGGSRPSQPGAAATSF